MPERSALPRPFQVFSWNKPFLPALKELIEKDTCGNSGSAVIIVPNNRPWRYFLELYRNQGRPSILPRMYAYADVINLCSASLCGQAMIANQLDLAALAWESVNEASKKDINLSSRFSKMEMGEFLPWGFRLSSLFDELFQEGLLPNDIAYAENDVAQPASALLSSLGQIGKYWMEGLKKHCWTTPGYNAFIVSGSSDSIPPMLMPSPEHPVYIAGFYELNGVQQRLFHSFWEKGATICLHCPAELAVARKETLFCPAHKRWISKWHARVELFEQTEESVDEKRISFFSAYDLHSQLQELSALVERNAGSIAVVLTNPDSLMPVLHHLPRKEVNISMGYPVERTLLHNFLSELFLLVKNRSVSGYFYWRDLLHLIRQPFLEILKEPQSGATLSKALPLVEKFLRSGNKYVDWYQLLELLQSHLDEKTMDLLQKMSFYCIDSFVNVSTPGQLGKALKNLGTFLLFHTEKEWENFPLDSEALNRLQVQVVPVLLDNALAEQEFDFETLESVFMDLISNERIPFEADPLVGIQILGLLETRLLQFDNVFVIDANEDLLPGGPKQDPLLPDSLRGLLGLPDRRVREEMAEYNFYRLCAGARNASLLWQEGIFKSELFDSKKLRSRFVEQLLWEEEKKQGKLLGPGDSCFGTAKTSLAIHLAEAKCIKRTQVMEQKLKQRLYGGLSATRLDQFYRCPLAFARTFLIGLEPREEVVEGDDPPLVGSLLHGALYDFYLQFTGKTVEPQNDKDFYNDLMECFNARMRSEKIYEKLPLDSCMMLEQGAALRLGNFLKNQPSGIKVEKLEWDFRIPVIFSGQTLKCRGIIDRLDERNGKHYILDYKTFKLKTMKTDLWLDDDFFKNLSAFCESAITDWDRGEELFLALREQLPSIQLPFYLSMLQTCEGINPGGAAYVDLYDTGKEFPLLPDYKENELGKILDNCRICIDFLLKHLFFAPSFNGNGETCSWCQFGELCCAR